MTDQGHIPPPKRRRLALWLGVGIAVLVVVALVGRYIAVDRLKHEIAAALGPNSEVDGIEAGFSAIVISGIRIRAGKDWPAAEELSARQVRIRPDWGALLSRTVRIAEIEIDGGYVSMLRRQDGKLVLLPSLLGRGSDRQKGDKAAGSGQANPAPAIEIARVRLHDAAVDFHDATVRQPAHRLRLERTTVSLGPILLPALTGRTSIALDGTIKGVQRDGHIAIDGWVEIATRDSEIEARLSGVDLVALQPYLIKATETGVRKGTLDLGLKSTVRKQRLHAPGRITLSDLELSSGKSFMGMPREAVVAMLKDRNGRIAVDFVLDGNLDDPRFSLNEKFLSQIGTATANVLGISLEGLARGIGTAGAGAASGIGRAVNKLLGEK